MERIYTSLPNGASLTANLWHPNASHIKHHGQPGLQDTSQLRSQLAEHRRFRIARQFTGHHSCTQEAYLYTPSDTKSQEQAKASQHLRQQVWQSLLREDHRLADKLVATGTFWSAAHPIVATSISASRVAAATKLRIVHSGAMDSHSPLAQHLIGVRPLFLH